mmetsp:Transcript_9964/g.13034  ORF Transcript_9964/g.13034 Transcript_9964/m.13034 type:complete len:99 (-) Transcript_9964:12-308(-)
MYNGIGLRTVRGSATNGYITKNASHVRHALSKRERKAQRDWREREKGLVEKKANVAILEHERKRKVEVKLMELRVTMEDNGYSTEEIDAKVKELREKN